MIVGLLERWDARNQRVLEEHNRRYKPDPNDDETPGPRWAWVLSGVPIIGCLGLAVILFTAWRRRKVRREPERR